MKESYTNITAVEKGGVAPTGLEAFFTHTADRVLWSEGLKIPIPCW